MGHAGAVISGGSGTAEAKNDAMREAGITVCDGPHVLGKVMKERLGKAGKVSRPAEVKVARVAPKPAAAPAAKAAPTARGKGAAPASKPARVSKKK
jgi:succinyl-CoA synthetase alpha subunit